MPILTGLSSLLTWYQIELRGRTQLGQGVLEMKVADWEGVLVANPDLDWSEVGDAFSPLLGRDLAAAADELGREDRLVFDMAYLSLCGAPAAEDTHTSIEREFRALMGERSERALSVADAKTARAANRSRAASVDAYAERIVEAVDSFPDPREFVPPETETVLVLVSGPSDGDLTVGEDLFTQGEVFAGGHRVAAAGDQQSARFVRGVLLHDRGTTAVEVPSAQSLAAVVGAWEEAIAAWQRRFDAAAEQTLSALSDDRLVEQIRARSLALLNAE